LLSAFPTTRYSRMQLGRQPATRRQQRLGTALAKPPTVLVTARRLLVFLVLTTLVTIANLTRRWAPGHLRNVVSRRIAFGNRGPLRLDRMLGPFLVRIQ